VKAASCLVLVLLLGVSAAGAATAVRVPPGFRVEVFVRGLERPTAMVFGPRGVLYLTQEGGEVVSVDLRTRRPRVILRGFRTPLGLDCTEALCSSQREERSGAWSGASGARS
jgi:hypothetical protein